MRTQEVVKPNKTQLTEYAVPMRAGGHSDPERDMSRLSQLPLRLLSDNQSSSTLVRGFSAIYTGVCTRITQVADVVLGECFFRSRKI